MPPAQKKTAPEAFTSEPFSLFLPTLSKKAADFTKKRSALEALLRQGGNSPAMVGLQGCRLSMPQWHWRKV
jgi:hypothetical protein